MKIELRSEHPSGPALAARVRSSARRILLALDRGEGSLSVLLTGDGRIRTLNRRFRGVDHATDVLSFPAHEPAGAGPDLGDLALSLDTASRRARRAGRTTGAELDRYLAHGILHLLGHDHARPGEAREMERAEDALLGAAGMLGEDRARRTRQAGQPRRTGRTGRGRDARGSRGAR